jgi:hypothetical protein
MIDCLHPLKACSFPYGNAFFSKDGLQIEALVKAGANPMQFLQTYEFTLIYRIFALSKAIVLLCIKSEPCVLIRFMF